MPAKPRFITGKPHRQNLLLDSATLDALDDVAPGNLSEAVRLCVQFALERGVQGLAANIHTDKQRAALHKKATTPAIPAAFAGWDTDAILDDEP